MPLPVNLKQVEKNLESVLPVVMEKGGWSRTEEVARCFRLLGHRKEARTWFLKAAEEAAAAAVRLKPQPAMLVQAGNYCRLAEAAELGYPYLERALVMLPERIALTNSALDYGHMATCVYLLGRLDEVGGWIQKVRERQSGKQVQGTELPAYFAQAQLARNPEPIRTVMPLIAEWIKKERIKPWWVGADISLHDWYEIGEQLLQELG